MPERAASWTRWLWLSAAVVVLDLATKALVTDAFHYGEVLYVAPFFNLVLVHNSGAAFSFLAQAGGWQRWFFTGVAAVISAALVWMLRKPDTGKLPSFGFALVLGGALGNLHDRVRLGYVVDFVQLHAGGYYFPAFNVADSAITVGVALLVWDSLRPAARAPVGATQEKP